MNIVIWSYANLERVYGIAFSLARFLRSQGHDVHVLYVGQSDRHVVDEDGIDIRSVASASNSGWRRVLAFWRSAWQSRERSDMVVLVGTRSALFSWPLWLLRRGRTMVFTYELDGDGRMEVIANRITRSADLLVEVNAHRARLRKVIARQPDAVVRNVPDRRTVEQICALRGLPRAPVPGRIMYGGMIAHYQGIDLMVRAFAASDARELELIGNPEDPAYLDGLRAIPLPEGKRLIITGPLPRPVLLQRLWQEASALVCLYPYDDVPGRMNRLNTKYAEPTKYYEYMLLGIPFVTFRHPSLAQMGQDGVFMVAQSEAAVADGFNRALACTRDREGQAFARKDGIPTYEDALEAVLPLLNRPSIRP